MSISQIIGDKKFSPQKPVLFSRSKRTSKDYGSPNKETNPLEDMEERSRSRSDLASGLGFSPDRSTISREDSQTHDFHQSLIKDQILNERPTSRRQARNLDLQRDISGNNLRSTEGGTESVFYNIPIKEMNLKNMSDTSVKDQNLQDSSRVRIGEKIHTERVTQEPLLKLNKMLSFRNLKKSNKKV